MGLDNKRRFGVAVLAALLLLPAAVIAAEGTEPSEGNPPMEQENVSIDVDSGASFSTIAPEEIQVITLDADGNVITGASDARTDVTLCSEAFEGTFPGSTSCNWELRYCGLGYTWDEDDCRASTGTKSAWCANGKFTNQEGLDPCVASYPNGLCSWIVAGPFDLSDATSASVTYDLWLRAESRYYDYFYVGSSTTGTSFSGGTKLTGDYGDVWQVNRTLSLSNRIGQSQVWIGFGFVTDGSNAPDVLPNGCFVDNIRIVKTAGSAPDLIVTALGLDDASCPTQVRAKVRNQGNANAGANSVRIWRGQTQLPEVGIRALAAGEEDWSGWSPMGSYSPGDYAMRACADIAGQIQEQDESNNCLTVNYTGWCQNIDLSVTTLQFDPANCPTRMRAEVHNAGSSAAGSSVCRFSVDDVQKCDLTVAGIAAGASVWTDWCAMGSTEPGNYQARACADATGIVTELNENNNCLAQNFGCSTSQFYIASGIQYASGQGDVELPVRALNTQALTAFSVSVCYDPDVFGFRGATVTGTRAAGAANIVVSDAQDGCVSVAVVYSYGCPASISAGDGAVLKLQLTVLQGAPVGQTPITFTDRPPSLNRMTLCDFSSITPGLGSETIEILSNGFVRGDYDASGSMTIADALAGLYYGIGEGNPPSCEDAADLNDDGVIDVSDAVYSLGYQFGGGSAPHAPFPGCGDDPTSDDLDCDRFAGCGSVHGGALRPSGDASTSVVELAAHYSATGDTLFLPMVVGLSEPAAGFDATLIFDPAALEFLGFSRGDEAAAFGFCSARLLPSGDVARLGVVRDLGLEQGLSAGRHTIGSWVFRVRDSDAAAGSSIRVTDGQIVTGPGATEPLSGATLVVPRNVSGDAEMYRFRLGNPYRPGMPIRLEVTTSADVRLALYDVHGRKVRDLLSTRVDAGVREIGWDGKGNGGEQAGTGVYYLSGQIGDEPLRRKLILIR